MQVFEFTCKFVACAFLMFLAEAPPKTAKDYVLRGMQRFRENKISESLEDFNQAARLDPNIAPHLWQRGLSDYYAGKFKEGREQFESHKTVNPDDVENAAWHFLCIARVDGVPAARKSLMKIDLTNDSRVPMSQVYKLYAGDGSPEDVLHAAGKANSEQALMYAHLYLGLYYEAAKDPEKAKAHMRQAAAAKLHDDYMHDVAKVHLKQRKWEQ